ncbi:hypothetical protein [Streptomyces phaeofaciens]|uniref:hypothetical protein n=1 Tax=Streptomyces phaeofaciens TaxID=68254 RepID=UPI0036A3032A
MSQELRHVVILTVIGLVTFTALTIALLLMDVGPTLVGPLILAIVVGVNQLLHPLTSGGKRMQESTGKNAEAKPAGAGREDGAQQAAGRTPGQPSEAQPPQDGRAEPGGPAGDTSTER